MADLRFSSTIADVNWAHLREDLIADNFHNGRTVEQLRDSFANSAVRVFVWEDNGEEIGERVRCIGTARALSDGVGNAYVVDVWTATPYRRQGIGRRMMAQIHTALAGQHVYLQTDDDAVEFYKALGFTRQPEGMSKVVGQYLQDRTKS